MNEDRLILIGQVVRPQGHRGEVRVVPVFKDLSRMEHLRTDTIHLRMPVPPKGPRAASVPMKMKAWRIHQDRFLILGLEGIPDMNAAEMWRLADVLVDKDGLWPAEEGEWFSFEIEGFEVRDVDTKRLVGMAKGLSDGAAHDYLLVDRVVTGEPVEGARRPAPILVPAVPEIIDRVDKAQRTVWVMLPEGLDEL